MNKIIGVTVGKRVNFRLKESKSVEKPIYLDYSYGYKQRLKFYLGYSVEEKFWDNKKQRIKNISNVRNGMLVNKLLNDLDFELLNFVTEKRLNNDTIDNDILKSFLKKKLGKETVDSNISNNVLIEWKNYLQSFKNTSVKNVDGETKGTYESYKQAFNHFQGFYEQTGFDKSFDAISIRFYDLFIEYMMNKSKADGEPYNFSSINKHVKSFKTFMHYCLRHSITNNRNFEFFGKLKVIPRTEVYLSIDEQRKLLNVDLKSKKGHELARDIFIIGCQIGQRIGDYYDLSRWEIIKNDGESYIQKKQAKTTNQVICQLPQTVLDFLDERYEGKLPPSLSPQKINDYIKEVGKIAGLTEMIKVDVPNGGAIDKIKKPKYEMIKGHTARRSFCTNKFLAKVPLHEIMKISGHKTEKEFKKYIRVDDLDAVVQISNSEAYLKSNI